MYFNTSECLQTLRVNILEIGLFFMFTSNIEYSQRNSTSGLCFCVMMFDRKWVKFNWFNWFQFEDTLSFWWFFCSVIEYFRLNSLQFRVVKNKFLWFSIWISSVNKSFNVIKTPSSSSKKGQIQRISVYGWKYTMCESDDIKIFMMRLSIKSYW